MNKITIDLSELNVYAQHAPEFALNISGEEHLLKLVELKNQIEDVYKTALNKLAEQAFDYNKDVKLIEGARVRVAFSRAGRRFEADVEQVDPKFVKTVKSLDTDAIDEFIKLKEELPKNVKLVPESDRTLSIRVKVKDNATADLPA